jgi:hypothetical protein
MKSVTENHTATPFKEKIYTSQFANIAHQLDREHCSFKGSVIDWQNRLKKEMKALQADKDNMEASGVHSPMRWQRIETLEGIQLQKAALNGRKEEFKIKIEPLLRSLVEFWPDILNAFEWNHISHIQFAVYLRKFRGILAEGRSFGLTCYDSPAVNKIAEYLIEKDKLM